MTISPAAPAGKRSSRSQPAVRNCCTAQFPTPIGAPSCQIYPTDLLNSPPQVLEAQVEFAPSAIEAPIVSATVPLPFIAKERKTAPELLAATAADSRRASDKSESTPQSQTVVLQANKQSTAKNAFTDLIATKQLDWSMVLFAFAIAAGAGRAPRAGTRARQNFGGCLSRRFARHHEGCIVVRLDSDRSAHRWCVSARRNYVIRIKIYRSRTALSLAGVVFRSDDLGV